MTLLACDNLHFAYGDQPVLRGVSLTLNPGEIVALLGPNGSGKSTLIRCLLGQLSGQGDVRWDDRLVTSWRRRNLARRVAYCPQSLSFEPGQTVGDSLRMGRTPYLGAFGVESQRDVQVAGEVAAMLDLSDLLDRPLDELSGGQRQRVFLGRCLVQEPSALLLDEPNTHLDLRHQVEFAHLLQDLARSRNLAVLMASHDINFAGLYADRLILLEQGVVAVAGKPTEVLAPEVISRVYGVAMERVDAAGRVLLVPALRASV